MMFRSFEARGTSAARPGLFVSLPFRLVSLVLLGLAVVAIGQDSKKPEGKKPVSVDELDFAKDLPRIDPLEPAEAIKTIKTAPGYRLELVTSEPNIADPVAIAFDENERMYAVEMRGYSENRDEKLSRIRLLEDRDNDGRYEHSTVFADGFLWPTAIFCWKGGVLVADAPDIFYLKDTNGDGKADEKKVLFTGYGISNVQGLLNSFHWSLDNRIIGATSSSGGMITRPDHPNDEPLNLRGRDFQIEPHAMTMQAVSGGAQHGASFNDWGDRFVCSNSDHLQHVLYEDRYLARNPYLAVPSARASIAADGPQADVYRLSPVEAWRTIRTKLRVEGIVKGAVEGGGRAAGYFTGATGVTIYRGDAWPAEHRGLAMTSDVGSNLIHRKKLEFDGVNYKGVRIDEKAEFIASSDLWFRPVQMANAPDGSLMVLDMYREVIEHPASIPPVIKKHLDLTSGRDRGRIYRVVPDGWKRPDRPKLGDASIEELVAALDHPNGWHRDTASRLIYEKQDQRAIPLLQKLASSAKTPQGRLHAMYALSGLNALTADVVAPRLHDEHPRLREHAVRLSESLIGDDAKLRSEVIALTNDPELRVRAQVAFSLGELRTSPSRNKVLAALLASAPDSVRMRVAGLSSLQEGAGYVLGQLAADHDFRTAAQGQVTLRALAGQIGKQQRPEDVADLMQALAKLGGEAKQAKDAQVAMRIIVESLALKGDSPLAQQVSAATGGQAEKLIASLVEQAKKTAMNDEAKPAARATAIRQLRLGTFADLEPFCEELLAPTQPGEVQGATLSVLGGFDAVEAAHLMVANYAAFSPQLKAQAADLLIGQPKWSAVLLDGLEEKQVAAADLSPAHWKLLTEHRDPAIRTRAAKLAESVRPPERRAIVEAYRDTLTAKGNPANGQQVFKRVCAACHKMQDMGHEIGPNLAAMKQRGAEAILINVLDPNREVNPQYLNYAALLQDGRTVSGMIAAETANSLTLRRAENQQDTVLRIDIDALRSMGQSLMPEGLEKQVTQAEMADLLAFLLAAE